MAISEGSFYFCMINVTRLQKVETVLWGSRKSKGIFFDGLYIQVYGLNKGEPRLTQNLRVTTAFLRFLIRSVGF